MIRREHDAIGCPAGANPADIRTVDSLPQRLRQRMNRRDVM